MLMVSDQNDSQGFLNLYNSIKKKTLEKIFIFTIYQNYTLALTLLPQTLFIDDALLVLNGTALMHFWLATDHFDVVYY